MMLTAQVVHAWVIKSVCEDSEGRGVCHHNNRTVCFPIAWLQVQLNRA